MGTRDRREGENLANCVVSSRVRWTQGLLTATQDKAIQSPVNLDPSSTELTVHCNYTHTLLVYCVGVFTCILIVCFVKILLPIANAAVHYNDIHDRAACKLLIIRHVHALNLHSSRDWIGGVFGSGRDRGFNCELALDFTLSASQSIYAQVKTTSRDGTCWEL